MSATRFEWLSPFLPAAFALLAFAPLAFAQSPSAPVTYAVTEVNAMFGPPVTTTTYRNGQVAVIDNEAAHTRSYYDLTSGRTFSWSTAESFPPCSSGTFSGDWGDPFQTAGLTADLAKIHHRDVGPDIVGGIRAKIVEADDPQGGGTIRLWLDASYGEVIKWVASTAGTQKTLLEVKRIALGPPPPAILALPPSCARIASQPPPPTEAQRIAALTGSAPGSYVSAIVGPASKDPCTVKFSVVQPGTMAPIASPYRVAIDASIDLTHPAAHEIGSDPKTAGKAFFSGGGLRELTAQIQNGALKLPDVAPAFDMELVFGSSGAASAVVYRQCSGKSEAKLFYVVKNASNPGDGGDWLWAK